MSIPSTRVAALAAAGALSLVLSACTPAAEPSPEPTPPASESPIFASDEEALAAAVEAYERFLDVSTAVSNDGGRGADRLMSVAIGQALQDEEAAAREFADEKIRTQGDATFTVQELQSVEQSETATVTIYVCDDIAELDLLDEAGVSIVKRGRVTDVPYTVVATGESGDGLKVSRRDLWERENYCLA
ncbi:hypothetical protein [Agromyces italicus]|uniref:hypothetical protein n=1 Tax=Agromyces italicus TaxID=279572 RepID=UPI0012FCC7D8|nr:hypothetical protein [Agromyces italicus]